MHLTRIILIFIVVLPTYGCGVTNPSITKIYDSEVSILSNRAKVFVPRFEGNPDFVEEATDYFVTILEAHIPNVVIQGSVLRAESTDIHSGGNLPPLEIALAAAKEHGADILMMGKVTSHSTGGTLNGFSTIRIYNTHQGTRVGIFHRPSGLLFGYSEHQCVMAAVKRTAQDVYALFD
jgi:hypothetical protein